MQSIEEELDNLLLKANPEKRKDVEHKTHVNSNYKKIIKVF